MRRAFNRRNFLADADQFATNCMVFISNWSWLIYILSAGAATGGVSTYGWGLSHGGWADQFFKLSSTIFFVSALYGVMNVITITACIIEAGAFGYLFGKEPGYVKVKKSIHILALWAAMVVNLMVVAVIPRSIWICKKFNFFKG